MHIVAKKSLGQNFLHAPNVISSMIKVSGIDKNSIVLEVGPGKGALTVKLLESGARVLAIEKDDRIIEFLNDKFINEIKSGQLEIVHKDVLEFDENNYLDKNNEKILGNPYILIANIPYYITGEFLRKFLSTNNPPKKMVLMLQKEVAKRIVDEKGSILSISVKAYGQPKYISTVNRKFFRPIPNVDSAILFIDKISKDFFKKNGSFDRIGGNIENIDERIFFEIVKTGFLHKRKLLIRNLEEKIDKNILNELWNREKWSNDMRAEDITIEMWKKIVGNSGLN